MHPINGAPIPGRHALIEDIDDGQEGGGPGTGGREAGCGHTRPLQGSDGFLISAESEDVVVTKKKGA